MPILNRIILVCASFLVISMAGKAAPITVGGFEFQDGERAFADQAQIVSGTLTGPHDVSPEETAQRVLVGSDTSDSHRVIHPDEVIIEIIFTDNLIVNGDGTDVIFFELSGFMEAGTPDSRERFGVTAYDGTGFPEFSIRDPVSTGVTPCGDTSQCLTLFVVEVDLTDFGIPAEGTTDRVRLYLFDPQEGTRSGDPTAIGALHSVPEPTPFSLLGLGLVVMGAMNRDRGYK